MSDDLSPRRRGRANLKDLLDTLTPSEPARAKTLSNSLGDLFVLLPAGSFRMGSLPDEPGHRTNEAPEHEVVLTKDFYLSVHPVSQRTYQAVMKQNPAFFTPQRGGGPDFPVENVTYDDASRFCERLTARPDEQGRRYRLPTEAEWEYACRGGTVGAMSEFTAANGAFDARYPLGGSPAPAAAGPTAAGRFPPNAFGLADMLGNVWEWCADWYCERFYAAAPLRDPAGPDSGTLRVIRGGSWKSQGASCRAAYRNALAPHQKNSATGFRVVVEVG